MKHVLMFTKSCWAVVLVAVMGLSAYGCSDSVSVSEDVEVPLSSLTVTLVTPGAPITPGTLRPGFSSNTTNYSVNAPTSTTSVTVTATPKDSTTTMTINEFVTTAGQGRSVQLGNPGTTTTITIVLESHNGTGTTYTVAVTRLLSGDNNLSALSVTPGNMTPSFDQDTEIYTVAVGVLVGSVTVSATKSDLNAVMSGSVSAGAGQASGQATITLSGPGTATPISIIVKAPNGSAKTYSVTVNRMALSGNNNLSDLRVSVGNVAQPLNPTFASGRLNYTVGVATEVTDVIVSATKSDPNAVLSGSIADPGTGQATGQATLPLGGPGTPTPVSITVTAPSGTSKTYTITVNRAAPSSDNNLSALTVTPGALNPAFASSQQTYTVDVATEVTSVNVVATKSDPNAVISGGLSNTGQATIQLNGSGTSTPISITVTAPNGSSQTYTITVNRAAPASDNNLSLLAVTGFSLVPDFAQNITVYSVQVPFSVNSVIVTATKSDANAVMSGDVTAGAGSATGQNTITLNFLLPTPVSITVTAANGDPKEYSIIITQTL